MNITEALQVMAGNPNASLRHQMVWDPAPAVIREPGAAHQVIAVLATEPTPTEAMVRVLTTLLDTARAASENSQTGGAAFLTECSAAFVALAGAGRLSGAQMLAWSGAYVRAGLEPPPALQVSAPAVWPPPRGALLPGLGGEPTGKRPQPGDPTGEMLDVLLSNLPEEPADAHLAIRELLGVTAVPSRVILLHTFILKLPVRQERLGVYWLFDPLAEIRRGAAHAIATRIKAHGMSAGLRRDLLRVRNWLPAEPGIDALAGLLDRTPAPSDAASQAAVRPEQDVPPGKRAGARRSAKGASSQSELRTYLSYPDGAGCISIVIASRASKGYALLVGLFKRGRGLRDAFVHSLGTAAEQRQTLDSISEGIDLVEVSPRFAVELLGRAIDDGLETGSPPAPMLLDAADLLERVVETPTLRRPLQLNALLADLPEVVQEKLKDKDLCSRLCGEDGADVLRSPLFETWFEQTEKLDAAILAAPTERAARSLVWKFLQERRGWWAIQFALAAQIMAASRASQTPAPPMTNAIVALAATAQALGGKGSIRKLAGLEWIMLATLDACEGRHRWDEEPDADLEAAIAPPLSPARELELARILKQVGLEQDWIDGFGAAASISGLAPTTIINAMLKHFTGIHVSDVQLMLDLCLDRVRFAMDGALESENVVQVLAEYGAQPPAAWANGFMALVKEAPLAFPSAKSGSDQGSRILRLISEARTRGLATAEQKIIAAWIAQCAQ
ncbi:MAG: hypothetical protein RIR33_536 [Pseudomonadota bacterium]